MAHLISLHYSYYRIIHSSYIIVLLYYYICILLRYHIMMPQLPPTLFAHPRHTEGDGARPNIVIFRNELYVPHISSPP